MNNIEKYFTFILVFLSKAWIAINNYWIMKIFFIDVILRKNGIATMKNTNFEDYKYKGYFIWKSESLFYYSKLVYI